MPDPSPAPLTPEELRELVELEKKATSAPWTAGDGGPKALYERCVILCSFGDSDTRILFTANHHFESEHDLALVSALRNAAPRLLSELAALREENERVWSYARHRYDCESYQAIHNDDGELQSGPCSCGFNDIGKVPAQEAREG